MKNRILLFGIALFTLTFSMQAQNEWGLKAGINFNTNGDLREFDDEVTEIYQSEAKTKSGYNFGLYGKVDLGGVYLRPELFYTKTTSEYELNNGQSEDYNVSKLDMPVLLGVKVVGPLSVFAGPAFQYYLDNDFEGVTFEDIENEFSVGLHLGAAVKLGRLTIDARYERGFSENEAEFSVENNLVKSYRLDSRPEQLMFGISYDLSK
ncbi:MAG TPA: porin family protein [Flavobacteriaceae bacterium]|nr:porin family protein [Flavobacteriaceae bacterium]